MFFYPYYFMMPQMINQGMPQSMPNPMDPPMAPLMNPSHPDMEPKEEDPKVQEYHCDDHGEDEMDIALMHKMYPEVGKTIYKHVKDYCDNLEKKDSCMYDEYPDYHTYQMIVDKIYNKMYKANEVPRSVGAFELLRNGQSNYFKELISVILLNEIFGNRRRRHRRRHRPYYGDHHHYKQGYPGHYYHQQPGYYPYY